MALLIEKNITGVLGTLDVSTLYLRLQCHLKYSGDEISIYNKIYLNKESYLSLVEGANVHINGIPGSYNFTYNRETDGEDLLVVSHDKVIEYLTTNHTKMVPQIDPSTGGYVYDPSTGEILLEEQVEIPKFCELSEISMIDVSIF